MCASQSPLGELMHTLKINKFMVLSTELIEFDRTTGRLWGIGRQTFLSESTRMPYAFPFVSVFVQCVCTVAPFHLMFRKFENKIGKNTNRPRLSAVQSAMRTCGWLALFLLLFNFNWCAAICAPRHTHADTQPTTQQTNSRRVAQHKKHQRPMSNVDAQRQSTLARDCICVSNLCIRRLSR